MKFVVAVTNNKWFEFLRDSHAEEANFWSPGTATVRLDPGTPWLFKLHAPLNYVVGGGYFVYRTELPLGVAWDTFGTENGASTPEAFRRLIGKDAAAAVIGCTVLAEPFFWSELDWLPPPPGWAPNIVSYKVHDTTANDFAEYWKLVTARLPPAVSLSAAPKPAFGSPSTYLPRLGQGAFRSMVIDAYGRRCTVTGERTLPALEAAHIVPFSEIQAHHVSNGLLLRADLHKLFDEGYVTVNSRYQFEVSKRIKDEYENGRDYYAMHGKQIALPVDPSLTPSLEYLEAHASRIYRG